MRGPFTPWGCWEPLGPTQNEFRSSCVSLGTTSRGESGNVAFYDSIDLLFFGRNIVNLDNFTQFSHKLERIWMTRALVRPFSHHPDTQASFDLW